MTKKNQLLVLVLHVHPQSCIIKINRIRAWAALENINSIMQERKAEKIYPLVKVVEEVKKLKSKFRKINLELLSMLKFNYSSYSNDIIYYYFEI